ncbi:MAG TPA: hypothetical protein DEB39_02015 [Planctomycetaceae bacterium]|nr:hypothetical protein [Planctomycetaceae bacterium]
MRYPSIRHNRIRLLVLSGFIAIFPTVLAAQDSSQDAAAPQQSERRDRRAANPFGDGPPPAGTVSIIGRSFVKAAATGGANNAPFLAAIRDERVRKDLGLSEEQTEQLKRLRDEMNGQALLKTPQYALRFKKMTPAEFEAIEKDISREIQSYTDRIREIATEEQMKKSRTLVFQTVGGLDSPIVGPDLLEALDLSEEQKEKSRGIFEATEKERLALLEEGLKLAEKATAAGGENKMSPEDREKFKQEAKLFEEKIFASGAKMGEAIRPLLSEGQRNLAARLMANRPDYLPPLPRQIKERLGHEDAYRPGEHSWQPGQGVPESREEDAEQAAGKKDGKRGFPRKKQ